MVEQKAAPTRVVETKTLSQMQGPYTHKLKIKYVRFGFATAEAIVLDVRGGSRRQSGGEA